MHVLIKAGSIIYSIVGCRLAVCRFLRKNIRQLVLTTTPVDAGWGIASSWNTRILQSYIQQTYGVSMSREGIRKLLHRLRLSWTRPTYKLVKGDAKRQAAFQKELEFIKKTNYRKAMWCFIAHHPPMPKRSLTFCAD
ncbi:helix-turn-helix domain-containing protein [Geobacillus stearothermophilus]